MLSSHATALPLCAADVLKNARSDVSISFVAILSDFERFISSFEEVLKAKLGVRTAQEVLEQLILTPARKEVLARSNTCQIWC